MIEPSMLNPDLTFERFVKSESNDIAFKVVKAWADTKVVAMPSAFIYGGAGLGKTHLLQAATHALREQVPESPIVYYSGSEFAEKYLSFKNNGEELLFVMELAAADRHHY